MRRQNKCGWTGAAAWTLLAAGAVAAVSLGGCQSPTTGGTAAADGPVRGDVIDIKPMGHTATAAAAPAAFAPPLYDTSGVIPMVNQPVTVPAPTPTPAAESPVQFAAAPAAAAPQNQTEPVTGTKPTVTRAKRAAVHIALAKGSRRTHVVRPGETLFAIARATYGDGNQWRRLAAANPAAASRPLHVGQKIVLP